MKPTDSLTDEQLVEQSKAGSEAAFGTLVSRYSSSVYRLALGITGAPQDAEDIVQETFLKVFKNLGRFSPSVASFKTWVLTIARNQSINAFHTLKRKAVRFFDDSGTDGDTIEQNDWADRNQPNPENLLSTRQEHAKVAAALKRLPARQRTALLLKAQEDLSYTEIASIMETTASSVESLIFRARRGLVDMLDGDR